MKAKTVTSAVLMGLWWVCTPAQAQEPPAPGIQPPPIKKETSGGPESLPPPAGAMQPSPSGLSDWIVYKRPDCCSPGPNIPIYAESDLRVGPSIPVGGNYLGRQLQVGWTIDANIRALKFNSEMTSAWVADLHILNSNNTGLNKGDPVVLNIFQKNAVGVSVLTNVSVTVRRYNRTMVGAGFGKEWYLWESANAPGRKWRAGVDGGGRYGSGSMQFPEIRHRTDTLGGLYAAAHTDFEIPCGRCFLSWGMRCEWAYTWGDILQKQSDVQEINVLATFGVRY
jgi:hypothetical protein